MRVLRIITDQNTLWNLPLLSPSFSFLTHSLLFFNTKLPIIKKKYCFQSLCLTTHQRFLTLFTPVINSRVNVSVFHQRKPLTIYIKRIPSTKRRPNTGVYAKNDCCNSKEEENMKLGNIWKHWVCKLLLTTMSKVEAFKAWMLLRDLTTV